MSDYPDIKARFDAEAGNAKMTVLLDDGLHRHLRFVTPHGFYWFEIVTVPGSLIFRGDGESFVFSCGKDTFELFRHGIHRDGSIHINPGYWDEKLSSERDAAQRYSMAKFEQLTAEQLADAEKEFPGVTAAWAEHVGEDSEYNTEYQSEAQRALYDFDFGETCKAICSCGKSETSPDSLAARNWGIKHQRQDGEHKVDLVTVPGFTFDDIEPRDLQDHYWWFLWALYAICWGIQRYDQAKADRTEQYEGELAHLRSLLAALQRLDSEAGENSPVSELLIDHCSDTRIVDPQLAEAGEAA
jgi:hypothetical protein